MINWIANTGLKTGSPWVAQLTAGVKNLLVNRVVVSRKPPSSGTDMYLVQIIQATTPGSGSIGVGTNPTWNLESSGYATLRYNPGSWAGGPIENRYWNPMESGDLVLDYQSIGGLKVTDGYAAIVSVQADNPGTDAEVIISVYYSE